MDHILIKNGIENMKDVWMNPKKNESNMRYHQGEQAILSQIARILVSEKLMSPEEHLRFLALLKEEG